MNLLDPVESLKGVGPKTAEILQKSGIKTVRDFLYNLPRDYENYQAPQKISEMKPGKVVIKGKIDSLNTRRTRRRNFTITEGIIRDNSDVIRVVWFNQPYRKKQFIEGKEYYFTGNYELKNNRFQLTSPAAALASDIEGADSFQPIYRAHSSLKSNDFHRLLANARGDFNDIPDLLPLEAFDTPSFVKPSARKNALFDIHFPTSAKDVTNAREYLAYEELFALILAAKLNKRENAKLESNQIPFMADKIKQFTEKLPYKLTNAQRLATFEILKNLEKNTPMNRLLQGDVGSGKTLVAGIAAYEVASAGFQVALLAPTAILASQHYESLKSLLEPFGIRIALLTGATKGKTSLKKSIKAGEIDLIIGTHAILTDDTEFQDLSLVIIDEQHRFGVDQREKLLLKSPAGKAPHLLAMTATPIPRSLQLTIFGDLDVSILNELPKGRQPIETKIIPKILCRETLYPKMAELLHQNQQIYWICPLIETTESTKNSTSVTMAYNALKKAFPATRIGILHGKMKPAEKDEIMEKFSNHEIDILVSTTVVEVGVNVPNANLIVIENAESFGLAQLHQLRGRVGRGSQKAYCFLLTEEDKDPPKRLRELEKSTDGFHLAEVDLNLRGPGEIYGNLQHGALDLRIATLADTKLINLAQKHVKSFLQNDENMLKYNELNNIIKKYQQLTTLN